MGNAESSRARLDSRAKHLDLSRNVGPKEYLQHLEGEEASSGCLKELPWELTASIGLHESLDVSFHGLSTVPENLPACLPHLTELVLSYNRIDSLPTWISTWLPHLTSLNVSHNVLQEIPSGMCVKLSKLDVSYNYLTRLPCDLTSAVKLVKLNVSYNQLTELPPQLGQLQSLEILLANGNPFQDKTLQAVSERGSHALIAVLKAASSEFPPQNHVRQVWNVFCRNRTWRGPAPSSNNPGEAAGPLLTRLRNPLAPPEGSSALSPADMADRTLGLLYGAVLGNSLGLSSEFLPPDLARFRYEGQGALLHSKMVRDGHRMYWHRGDWTTACDLMLVVLDSLLHWGGVVDEVDFATRLSSWAQSSSVAMLLAHETQEKGYKQAHPLCSHVLKAVVSCKDFIQQPNSAALRLWKEHQDDLCDNGFSIQAALLGIPNFHDLTEVASNSERICKTTHVHPSCVAAGVAISVLVAQLLQAGEEVHSEEWLSQALSQSHQMGKVHLQCPVVMAEFACCFSPTLSSLDDSCGVLEPRLQSHPFTPLKVAVALLRQTARNGFQEGVTRVVLQCGHSSINAGLAGALLGCREGYSSLPCEWLQGLPHQRRTLLDAKLNGLLDLMGLP